MPTPPGPGALSLSVSLVKWETRCKKGRCWSWMWQKKHKKKMKREGEVRRDWLVEFNAVCWMDGSVGRRWLWLWRSHFRRLQLWFEDWLAYCLFLARQIFTQDFLLSLFLHFIFNYYFCFPLAVLLDFVTQYIIPLQFFNSCTVHRSIVPHELSTFKLSKEKKKKKGTTERERVESQRMLVISM